MSERGPELEDRIPLNRGFGIPRHAWRWVLLTCLALLNLVLVVLSGRAPLAELLGHGVGPLFWGLILGALVWLIRGRKAGAFATPFFWAASIMAGLSILVRLSALAWSPSEAPRGPAIATAPARGSAPTLARVESCDLQSKAGYCVEVPRGAGNEEACAKREGILRDGPCPRENMVGGCPASPQAPLKLDTWYYRPTYTSLDDIECRSMTAVPPRPE